MTARVAVLLPVYNAGEYLNQAVDSVLGQSFTDFTLILADDGSTDAETLRILNGYEQNSQVRMLRNKTNKGLAATLNVALETALADPACKYVARMDADDICHPDRLARQVAYMDTHRDIGISGTAYVQFEDGREHMHERVHQPTSHEQLMARLLFQPPFAHPTVMIRSKALHHTQARYDENLPCTEDYELWARLLLEHNLRGGNIDEPLLRYRRHPKSMGQRLQKQENQIADNVRARVLTAFGFSVSCDELHRHNALARGDLPKKRESVHKAVLWLDNIRKNAAASNTQNFHRLNRQALDMELDSRLLHTCDHATTLGPMVWRLWRQYSVTTKKDGARLLVKSMLHWDNDRSREHGLRKRLKEAIRRLAAGSDA